jgi:hypothetical protein
MRKCPLTAFASISLALVLVGCCDPHNSNPVKITVSSLPATALREPYSTTLTASGGSGSGYAWSITSGSLPTGLSLGNSTGTIEGEALSGGIYDFIVSASDDAGNSATKDLSILVDDSPIDPRPFLDIAARKIFNASSGMEYSLDDRAGWTSCEGPVVDLALAVGDKAWIREKGDPSRALYLGEVAALSGPDLGIGRTLYIGTYADSDWNDRHYGVAGETMYAMGSFRNRGTASCYSPDLRIDVYISTDPEITAADTLLISIGYAYDCPVGEDLYFANMPESFVLPASLPSGAYYIGAIVDAGNAAAEMNEGDNATKPEEAVAFTLLDPSSGAVGAFKFVNSWGTRAKSAENVLDGHYWVGFESMIALKMPIYYTFTAFSAKYRPTILAEFNIAHPHRDECKVTLGIGDPGDPRMRKVFQAQEGSTLVSGHQAFPDSDIVIDISEFAPYINDYDLYLRVDDSSSEAGILNSFSVEYYGSSDQAPIADFACESPGAFGSGAVADFTVSTAGRLTPSQLQLIQPPPRAIAEDAYAVETSPDADELARDEAVIGVYEAGRDYNQVFDGHGTGLIPPSEDEWPRMRKLRSVTGTSNSLRASPILSVDNSKTAWFPPIGNQGRLGSCTAWAAGYYAHTFAMAKKNGWSLSGVKYGGQGSGAPLSAQDRIMSPSFIYNQINNGVDNGSWAKMAQSLIDRIGCATWQSMPYDGDTDSDLEFTSWPGEAAFREAANYRSSGTGGAYWSNATSGYLIIAGMSDIEILKSMISAGYCAVASIRAGDKSAKDNLYYYLSPKDVVAGTTFEPVVAKTNHAQTIVGFKEGTAWDPNNPDL